MLRPSYTPPIVASVRDLLRRVAGHDHPRWDVAAQQAVELIVAQVERRDSILCTCGDSPPTNPKTRERMDHHCDCRAVETSATLLGRYSATQHARQCDHGTEFDEFYAAGGDQRD